MNDTLEDANVQSLGTGRMTVVLGAALLINVVLVAAPWAIGSSRGNAVASPAVSAPLTSVERAPLVANVPPAAAAKRSAPPSLPLDAPPVVVAQEEPAAGLPALAAEGEPVAVNGPTIVEATAVADSPAVLETIASSEPPFTGDLTATPPVPEIELDAALADWTLESPAELTWAPAPAPMPDYDPCVLEIVNPLETNGPVHFVIEGAVHTLLPGESRQWLALGERKVEFHRGDEFGDISYQVERGTWRFQVTDAGWELVAAEHVSMFVQP